MGALSLRYCVKPSARTLASASVAVALMAAGTIARAAGGTLCTLPVGFRLAVEERGILDRGGATVVAVAPSPSGLVSGDVIRQANGTRVADCAELERVAAEAAAKGLVLLMAVERQGQVLGIAATTAEIDTRVAARAGTTEAPRPVASLPAPAAAVAAPPPVPVPIPSPRPRRMATNPARGDASAEFRRRAGAAATALTRVDDAARAGVPIAVYERRLGDAEAALATLELGVGAIDSQVRDFVEETVALHRTARDIRRAQLALLSQSGVDRRAPAASTLPYFSDSKVPEWVAAYPFLQVTILQAPHETRLPVPGEVAGRWQPDRALELLWERARTAAGELAGWAQPS